MRAGASPSQKGMVGGRSPASWTRTVPVSTLATRQEWVPSRKMSPAVASTAKSSCTDPTVIAVGIEHHPVVARLGDGPSAGEGGQPRAASSSKTTVDGVVVEVGAPPTASGLDPPRDQFDHLVEAVPGEVGVGCRPSHQLEEGFDVPLAGRGHLGHELLGQDVERCTPAVAAHRDARPGLRPGERCTRPTRPG